MNFNLSADLIASIRSITEAPTETATLIPSELNLKKKPPTPTSPVKSTIVPVSV